MPNSRNQDVFAFQFTQSGEIEQAGILPYPIGCLFHQIEQSPFSAIRHYQPDPMVAAKAILISLALDIGAVYKEPVGSPKTLLISGI